MRSYKDCLIEYLEEIGYSDLNKNWYSYFTSSLNGLKSNSFQLLEELTPIESNLDYNFYGDVLPSSFLVSRLEGFSPEKRSTNYKSLIKKIIEGEYANLKNELSKEQFNWKICRSVLHYPREKKYVSYSKSLARCLESSKVPKEFIESYLTKEEKSDLNFFSIIEDFFDADHYHLNLPNYEPKLSSVIAGTSVIDFDKDGTYNVWSIDQSGVLKQVTPD